MPREVDPRLEGLPAGGQGSASAEEMARRFPEMFGGLTPEDVKSVKEGTFRGSFRGSGNAPPGARPPENYKPVDYTAEGRQRFEQIVLNKIGGNPFEIDPYEFVDQVNAKLPDIFNKVFRGKIIWSDRDKLDKDQTRFWNEVVKNVHAQVFDRVQNHKKMMLDQYNFAMNQFDSEAKLKAKAMNKFRAPTTKALVNKKGDLTLHQWNGETGEWMDTGMKTKESKAGQVPTVVGKALGLLERAAKAIDPNLSFMLASNPEIANEPWFKAAMSKGADPRWKDVMERQFEIVETFYGTGPEGPGTMGSAQKAEEAAKGNKSIERSIAEYRQGGVGEPEPGMEVSESAPGQPPGQIRIRMDKNGNIIQ